MSNGNYRDRAHAVRHPGPLHPMEPSTEQLRGDAAVARWGFACGAGLVAILWVVSEIFR